MPGEECTYRNRTYLNCSSFWGLCSPFRPFCFCHTLHELEVAPILREIHIVPIIHRNGSLLAQYCKDKNTITSLVYLDFGSLGGTTAKANTVRVSAWLLLCWILAFPQDLLYIWLGAHTIQFVNQVDHIFHTLKSGNLSKSGWSGSTDICTN